VLPDDIVAAFLTLSLTLVLVRAIYEFRKSHRGKRAASEEVELGANDPLVVLGAVFVVVGFYFEMVLYAVLVLVGFQQVLVGSFAQLRFPFDSLIQALGMSLIVLGYLIVFLGLRAIEYDRLVTSGPYRYVRHPQYVGYFFVFAGFFLLLLNWIALIPLLAILGEVRMANIEEEFLIKKFDGSYVDYRKATGKFFPKIRHEELRD
jgi:protein-S-isoprenylcysteine O-methyltransferase Ste14